MESQLKWLGRDENKKLITYKGLYDALCYLIAYICIIWSGWSLYYFIIKPFIYGN